MRRSAISVAMLILFLIPVSVMAVSQRCIDNSTIERVFNYTFGIEGDPVDLNVSRQETCPYGCDNVTSTCAPNPAELSYGFGLLLIVILIGTPFLVSKLIR